MDGRENKPETHTTVPIPISTGEQAQAQAEVATGAGESNLEMPINTESTVATNAEGAGGSTNDDAMNNNPEYNGEAPPSKRVRLT